MQHFQLYYVFYKTLCNFARLIKNVMNRHSFVLTLFIIGSSLMLFSQPKGYKIKVLFPPTTDELLYLKGSCGAETILVDSAKISKNQAVFKNKAILQDGYYEIVNAKNELYTDLIIDFDRDFTIILNKGDKTAEGSPENQAFFEFQKVLNRTETVDEKERYIERFIQISPESLLSHYCQMNLYKLNPEKELTIDNYFDDVNLQDFRMLRHPFFHKSVIGYVSETLSNIHDNIHLQENKIVHFFKLCDRESEIGQYYLQWMIQHFNTDGNSSIDAVLVFLYDNYCQEGYCHFLSENNARLLKNTVTRKRRLLPDAEVPVLSAYNSCHQIESTEKITKKYTVLWFWDPDCEDCLIETPLLHTLYMEHATDYDFEVFAVAITEDTTRWENNLEQMQLTWMNTCYGMGEPNYDFVDYFDLLTTPASFLIDDKHKIIMHHFSLDELEDFLKFNSNIK